MKRHITSICLLLINKEALGNKGMLPVNIMSIKYIFIPLFFLFEFIIINIAVPIVISYTQAKKYYDELYIDYHIEFFKAGINAVIKKWLFNGCIESPEEIEHIIISEYKKKN